MAKILGDSVISGDAVVQGDTILMDVKVSEGKLGIND